MPTVSVFTSVREAAELIGVCRETVRQEIKAGRLVARQKGSKWLVLRESVEEWIALETDEARQAQEKACGMKYLRHWSASGGPAASTLPRAKGGPGERAVMHAAAMFKAAAKEKKARGG